MNGDHDNFIKWFKNPITSLHKNTDAGFVILMASLPLLERYLREKTGVHEKPLEPRFYEDFVKIFPSARDWKTAKTFWEIYRHGLLHQATLKTKAGIIEAAVHNEAKDLEIGYNRQGLVFTVSPVKFSEKIIEAIELDFPTFKAVSSSHHPPGRISPSTGYSGY
jgi:hypothetical protein